jgi:hypothetical protein
MSDGKLSNVLKAKEDLLKSPEQLEQEKQEILKSRLVRLELDRADKNDLIEQVCTCFTYYSLLILINIFSYFKAQKFYEILVNLHSQIYDMTEKQDKQKYEVVLILYLIHFQTNFQTLIVFR